MPIQKRIGPDREPRDLKQEGLFVPVYPKIAAKNMRKFQQRLVAENNTYVLLNVG